MGNHKNDKFHVIIVKKYNLNLIRIRIRCVRLMAQWATGGVLYGKLETDCRLCRKSFREI